MQPFVPESQSYLQEHFPQHDETLRSSTAMTRFDFLRAEPSVPFQPEPLDQATFSAIYDRYAPGLLGVIATIVDDETEAIQLLEETFSTIRLTYEKPRSKNQPLFVWLLSVARNTALDAKKKRKIAHVPVFKIAESGKIVAETSGSRQFATSLNSTRTRISASMSELLNAVLFRNCTPDEAVSSLGLPVSTARQQLRTAMQELRASNVS